MVAERTHSGLRLALLYPLHPKVPALAHVPRPVRRRVRRSLTAVAVRAHVRRCGATTFAGVTGSRGKTTTKDLLAHMLASAGPTAMTHCNDNGIYGVPASLLSVRPSDRFAAIELGILGGPGEMRWMAGLFRPHVAVLTGIGDDHRPRFGSREAIAREKRALLARLGPAGTAVVSADDPLARRAAAGLACRVVRAGWAADADVRLVGARLDWPHGLVCRLEVGGRLLEGDGGAPRDASGSAGGAGNRRGDGVRRSRRGALAAAAQFSPRPGRLCPVRGRDGVTFVLDDFTSRMPGAVAAVTALRHIPAARRIAVIGEVQECPPVAWRYRRLADALGEGVELVVAVGASGDPLRELLGGTALERRLVCASGAEEAAAVVAGAARSGDVVLLHGPADQDLGRIARAAI